MTVSRSREPIYFSISPRGLNLYQGHAHDRYEGQIDKRAMSVTTDKQGRFKLPSGGASRLAISSKQLDAWTASFDPESEKELKITLPKPTELTIDLDIKGGRRRNTDLLPVAHTLDGRL